MPGTVEGASKRLKWSDLEALAPVFGFGNDVDSFAEFVVQQQQKADEDKFQIRVCCDSYHGEMHDFDCLGLLS